MQTSFVRSPRDERRHTGTRNYAYARKRWQTQDALGAYRALSVPNQAKPEETREKEEENYNKKEIWKVLFSIVSRIIPTDHLKVNTVHIWCNQMCTHITYCVRADDTRNERPKKRERGEELVVQRRTMMIHIYRHCALGITCALNYCSHSDIHLVITRAARCLRTDGQHTEGTSTKRRQHTPKKWKHIINTGPRDAWMSKLNKRGEWATTSLR